MALRIASILGAGCLGLQPWHALGNDAKDWEYFPLSGGIDNGVQATIKATIKVGGTAKIEFVDRERKSAFSFHVDTQNQVVTRSADASFNSPSDTTGEWPATLGSGSKTFVFTKRKFEMSVSIHDENGVAVRFPWYDYSSSTQNLLTHVRVNSEGDNAGVEDPEVTLERPTCSNKCHPDECRDAQGGSLCSDPNGCTVVEMGDQAGVAKQCSAQTTTSAGGSMHCCDGTDVTPKARSTLSKGTWATVSSSSTYLERVCTAFAVSPCPTALAGKKVKVDNATDAPTYKVFAPSLATKTQWPEHTFAAEAYKTLPSFALYESFENTKVTATLPQNVGTGLFDADPFHDVITAADGAALGAADLEKGQYVHLIEWYLFQPMVTKFTRKTKDVIRGRQNTSTLYASDYPIALSDDCTDIAFTDANNATCAAYTSEICTSHGYPTESYCTSIGKPYDETCRLPRGSQDGTGINVGDDAAGLMCCACGGGSRPTPTGWPAAASTSQLEVVM